MQHLTLHRLLLALLLVAGVSVGPASAKEKPIPALYLSISVPPMWDNIHETDITNAFHHRVAQKLTKAGFVGEIAELDRRDDAAPGIPVLALNLMQWRPERTGNVICTFSANYKHDGKDTNLGILTGIAPQWMTTASRTWELRRGLDDSADNAINGLVKKLRAEQLLPPANKRL